jgi:hypothetical protein
MSPRAPIDVCWGHAGTAGLANVRSTTYAAGLYEYLRIVRASNDFAGRSRPAIALLRAQNLMVAFT